MYLISQMFGTPKDDKQYVFLTRIDAQQAKRMLDRLNLVDILLREHRVGVIGDCLSVEGLPDAWFLEMEDPLAVLQNVGAVFREDSTLIAKRGMLPISEEKANEHLRVPKGNHYGNYGGRWRYVNYHMTHAGLGQAHAVYSMGYMESGSLTAATLGTVIDSSEPEKVKK